MPPNGGARVSLGLCSGVGGQDVAAIPQDTDSSLSLGSEMGDSVDTESDHEGVSLPDQTSR